MAIRKQNRSLLIFVAIVLAGLGYLLIREGKMSELYTDGKAVGTAAVVAEDANVLHEQGELGAVASTSEQSSLQITEKQKAFAVILDDLSECLNIKTGRASGSSPVSVETILSSYQSELGAINSQSDRWVNWHLRNRDGKERRLRLEVKEDESGRPSRELHYYAVDRGGELSAIELPDDRSQNPSDDTIMTMLREGEVFFKDRAAFAVFSGGERIEYVEKNGELSEIEFIKGDSFFRCADLSSRENCQCTR